MVQEVFIDKNSSIDMEKDPKKEEKWLHDWGHNLEIIAGQFAALSGTPSCCVSNSTNSLFDPKKVLNDREDSLVSARNLGCFFPSSKVYVPLWKNLKLLGEKSRGRLCPSILPQKLTSSKQKRY